MVYLTFFSHFNLSLPDNFLEESPVDHGHRVECEHRLTQHAGKLKFGKKKRLFGRYDMVRTRMGDIDRKNHGDMVRSLIFLRYGHGSKARAFLEGRDMFRNIYLPAMKGRT